MNQKSFWPSVYKLNINRYPEVLSKYGGSANQVMKAEKKAIWDALHYEDECKLIDIKNGSKCRGMLESRHRHLPGSQTFTKKAAFKTCKYRANGTCVAANVKLDQSLQFLRWLLFSVDPIGFQQYVHEFPHQLTERNYGYNIEENEQYIPEQVVEELQQYYMMLPEAVEQQIENVSPAIARMADIVEAAAADPIRRANPIAAKKQRRSSGTAAVAAVAAAAQKELKTCVANSKRLEDKLKDHEIQARELADMIRENRTLKQQLREATKSLTATQKDRDELEKAYNDAAKYADDCVKARSELKELRQAMEKISKQRVPSEQDLKRAFAVMTEKIGMTMTRIMTAANRNAAVEASAIEIRNDYLKMKRVMEDEELTTSEKAALLIKFYIDLFDTKTGYLSEAF